jgi:serine/threonine-protein kinase
VIGLHTGEQLPSRIGIKYRPVRIIGRGGMSVVYEVEHELTRDRLALKVLRRETVFDRVSLARFRREARIFSLIKNDHVVRVLDADLAPELGDAPYLVMDLLKGADLATVSAGAPQTPTRVVGWLRQAARALDAAHRCGVVHRDIKPENLFLAESPPREPVVKVLDFGIASVPAADGTHETSTKSIVGTPMFMAPEHASGGEVGPHADGWSLAMCAFRLLSGRSYWQAESSTLLLAKIIYEQILPPSVKGLDLGSEFDAWFLRACARNPEKRWETVGVQVEAMAAALGRPVEPLAIPQRVEEPPPPRMEMTLPELAASEIRSLSLAPAYSSTRLPRNTALGWVGAAFGLATLGTAMLLSARHPVNSAPPKRVEPAQAKVSPAPSRVPSLAPSASGTVNAEPIGTTEAKIEPASQANAPAKRSKKVAAGTRNVSPVVSSPLPPAPSESPRPAHVVDQPHQRDPLADPD